MFGVFVLSYVSLMAGINARRVWRLIRTRGRSRDELDYSQILKEAVWMLLSCVLGAMVWTALYG